MKVLLANDTGTVSHVGCQGVSNGHARMLGMMGHEVTHRLFLGSLDDHVGETDDEIVASLATDDSLMAKVDAVDAVVVNGEGTIHHGAGRALLALLAIGQQRRKVTLLVNAVFQETAGFDDTILALDDFTVRESRSHWHARDRGFRSRVVPDSILAAKFETSSQRIRGEVFSDAHWSRPEIRSALITYAGRHSASHLPLHYDGAERDWMFTASKLSSAELIVTARHHGVYLAILAGVPFVALGSNTHKIEGTLHDIHMELTLAHDAASIERARAWSFAHADVFSTLHERLTNGDTLSTFTALGRGGQQREAEEVDRLYADVGAVLKRN